MHLMRVQPESANPNRNGIHEFSFDPQQYNIYPPICKKSSNVDFHCIFLHQEKHYISLSRKSCCFSQERCEWVYVCNRNEGNGDLIHATGPIINMEYEGISQE